ncbi:hypothetical protein AB0F88_39895 [Streptosporangium sp. NPDC023963]|uniref:hypothetical protein n=1 Tax=Streptosporangium sp. NPDC023963 TaxID=3155608 RepID=UPI00343B6401
MTVQATTSLRDQIRKAVLHAECEQPQKCPDCITDSVLSVVAADVARSARAAQDCGKATASLIDLFHAALRAHRELGSDAAVRVLLDHGADVPEFLDGLDLPAPA